MRSIFDGGIKVDFPMLLVIFNRILKGNHQSSLRFPNLPLRNP